MNVSIEEASRWHGDSPSLSPSLLIRVVFSPVSPVAPFSRGLTAAARDRPTGWLPTCGVVAINTSGDSRHDGVREERERFSD